MTVTIYPLETCTFQYNSESNHFESTKQTHDKKVKSSVPEKTVSALVLQPLHLITSTGTTWDHACILCGQLPRLRRSHVLLCTSFPQLSGGDLETK